jgi:2-polyprenyl-3-methyl-5-hydroxy-6-metoxy-1,4-benzoquinol methylase
MNKSIKHIFFFVIFLNLIACTGNQQPVDEDDTIENVDSSDSDLLGEEEISEVIPEVDQGQQGRLVWQQPGKVLSVFGDITGKTVADIGAGAGFFTARLAYMGAKVLALDIDAEAIKFINEELKVALKEKGENIEGRLVAPDNTFLKEGEVDYILIVNTLPYITNRISYLKHLTKALKKNGQIVIVDFKMKKIPAEVSVPLDERLPLYLVEQELEKAGFTLLKSDDASLDYQYIVQAIVE